MTVMATGRMMDECSCCTEVRLIAGFKHNYTIYFKFPTLASLEASTQRKRAFSPSGITPRRLADERAFQTNPRALQGDYRSHLESTQHKVANRELCSQMNTFLRAQKFCTNQIQV